MRNAEYDPNRIFQSLEDAAEAWTKADQQHGLLEKMGEHLLSKMVMEERDRGTPATLCKDAARSREEWVTHFEGELVARERAQRSKATYFNLQTLASARQTEESSRRALTR